MKVLFFLAFIGSVCALQYPLEYHYQYEGKIASGIPAIRPQVAAFGIKAKLILQMKEKTHGLAKLTDIEIGEYNEDLQCVHLRKPVPFSYQSIPNHHKQILEQPFVVYFLEESRQVMDVPHSDVEFITNIRKSIVEMLRLEPILANLGDVKGDQLSKHISGDRAPEAFTVEEESFLGRCESEYTIKKLNHHDLQEEEVMVEKHLNKDVQSKTSPRSRTTSNIPKLEDEYYRLVRSINFHKCHDVVILQHAGGANMSHEDHSLFRAVHSRSSVSTYLLKGSPGAFRVERAIVEGDVIANPFGFRTERLQTSTNQTLILESAQTIRKSLILPTSVRPVKSWRYEVASPHNPSLKHRKQWVNYYNKEDKYYPVSLISSAEISLSSQDIQQYQKSVFVLLDETVKEFYSGPSSPSHEDPHPRMTKASLATTRLQVMTHIMRTLPIDRIREIFSKTFGNTDIQSRHKQMLLIDVAAASGAAAPIKVLLEKMEKKEISPERIASIFLTLPNNLYSPSVIPELIEYVKRLNIETNPLLTSSALINVASLVERVCINHKKFNYSIPSALFGKEHCDPSILKYILPFLAEKAKSASKSHERAIYIQAINNLGSPQIIPVLKPFINYQNENRLCVRSLAIYGLSHLRLPDSAKESIFETLMPIVDNTEERPELRQAAFSTLVTWHPSASWWQRMARSTWREPSRNMATFITLTVESLARSTEPHLTHQARIAAFVLPLLKPSSPSLSSSYNRIYSRYDPQSKVGMKFDFVSIKSEINSAPFQMFGSLHENLGDLHLHLFEGSVTYGNLSNHVREFFNLPRSGDVVAKHAKTEGRIHSGRKLAGSTFHERFEKLSDHPHTILYLRTFQNLYQYIPINADVISKVAGKDAEKVLRELLSGIQVHATKYLNPLSLEFFLPTEIGLPLRGQAVMPTVHIGEVDVKLVAPGLHNPTLSALLKHHHLSLRFKSNYKYSSKLIAKLTVFNPLNMKMAEAGVENYAEMNLPFYGNLSFNRSNEMKNFSLSVSPHTQQKFPVFHQHNVPFTMLKNAIPNKDMTTDHKVIAAEKDRKPASKIRKHLDQRYTGISSELSYSGDAPYPFTSAFLLDYLRKPEQQGMLLSSPVSKQWQYSLLIDPSSSETKNVTLAVSFVSAEPSPSNTEERIPDFSVNDSPHQRLQKMKQISKAPKARIRGVNAQLFFNSRDFRRYEVVLAYGRSTPPLGITQDKNYRVVAAALFSRVPGHLDSPRALCSDSSLETPNIRDLESLKTVVRSHPQERLSSQIYYGKSCRSDVIATARGTIKLSDEREKLVSEELDKLCNHDSMDPAVQLPTAAVYDVGAFHIDFSKAKIPRSILNASYSLQQFIEGALFPHGYYNNIHSGQPNKIKIEARRPVFSKKYSFSVETPQKHSIFSEIQVPYVATKIVPFTGLQSTHDEVTTSLLVKRLINAKCYFKRGSIKTFDNLRFIYRKNSCWAVLVKNHNNDHDYVIRARWYKGFPQAQIILPDGITDVTIDYAKVVVNEMEVTGIENRKVIKSKSGEPILSVEKYGDSHRATYTKRMTIIANRHEIHLEPTEEDMVHPPALRGLCGDYDHSKAYDETGPEECLYDQKDAELFQYSWTSTEGDSCNVDKVNEMHHQVEQYQKTCSHRPINRLTGYEKDNDCMESVYPVVPDKDKLCASYETEEICKEGCIYTQYQTLKLNGGCWPAGQAPPDVKEGEERGYIYQPPAEKAPSSIVIVSLSATECHKKK